MVNKREIHRNLQIATTIATTIAITKAATKATIKATLKVTHFIQVIWKQETDQNKLS